MDIDRQFDHLAQIGTRRAPGNHQALFFELGEQRVVHLVAMAMTFDDFRRAVDLAGQRAFGQLADLRAEAHGAAEIGILVALLDLARSILPLGDQADHRVRRIAARIRC